MVIVVILIVGFLLAATTAAVAGYFSNLLTPYTYRGYHRTKVSYRWLLPYVAGGMFGLGVIILSLALTECVL